MNAQRDSNGLPDARKSQIRTEVSLNINGLWPEDQLFDSLQPGPGALSTTDLSKALWFFKWKGGGIEVVLN